jgi:pilus assembly protein Flp/PilA
MPATLTSTPIMNALAHTIRRFAALEDGVTAMEYALLGVLIAVVCVTGVTLFGTQTAALYTMLRDVFLALGL